MYLLKFGYMTCPSQSSGLNHPDYITIIIIIIIIIIDIIIIIIIRRY